MKVSIESHSGPFEKFKKKIKGSVSQTQCIFDPMLVKPKCVWEAVVYSKKCKQTAEKCKQIFENWKKSTASQPHFGFTNIGSNMHHFWATAFYFCIFSYGTPCIKHK